MKRFCAAEMLSGKVRRVNRADPTGGSRPGRALEREVRSVEGNPRGGKRRGSATIRLILGTGKTGSRKK